jgi:iron complex outermembrane receptor protein
LSISRRFALSGPPIIRTRSGRQFRAALRTPPKVDEGIQQRFAQVNPNPPPLTFILVSGTPAAESEILHAYELGYRYEWKEKFSADATIYYNGYGDLTGLSAPGALIVNTSPFFIDIPEVVENQERGQTHGLELSIRYAPIRRWTILTTITELRGSSTPGTFLPAVANSTRQQVNAQSRLDLTRHLNFDSNWYHYNAIPGEVPLINRVDVGVSTNPFHGFTFSVWGRNLQQNHHLETVSLLILGGEVRRSVVFKIVWEPNKSSTSAK